MMPLATEFDAANVVVAVLCTVIGVLWIVLVLPNFWRGKGPVLAFFRYDPSPRWWIWGAVLWHAYVRAAGWLSMWFSLIGPMLLIEFLAPAAIRNSFVFGSVLVFWAFAGMVFAASIVLVNRPRLLIPDPLRVKPGLIVEVLARTKKR
jgi:hypothetical protein